MNFFEIKKPNKSYQLDVSDLHSLYIEEYGSPSGSPVLFLHGGPGAGFSPEYQKYFDPKKYRLIIFDQRGCGQSRPYGETNQNTSQDLVDDINRILDFFNIDQKVINSIENFQNFISSISDETPYFHISLANISKGNPYKSVGNVSRKVARQNSLI